MADVLKVRLSRRSALALCLAASTGFSVAALAAGIKDAAGFDEEVMNPKSIITIGNAVTEIVFALGMKDKVIGVDTTSKSVPGAEALPDVGYMRALAPEGILAQTPDLIIATLDSGPKEVIEILRQSKVPLAQVPIEPSIDGIVKKIEMIGTLLGRDAEAKSLVEQTRQQAGALSQMVASLAKKPKTLFVLSMAGGKITAGGSHSSAGAILDLVGADNVAASINGYQPISPEILAVAPPDAIVVMATGPTQGLAEKVKADPVLANTPAAKADAIYMVDDAALLGFGTRSLDAASVLAKQLHG